MNYDDRDPLTKNYRFELQRKHKTEQHISFLSKCLEDGLLPNFTRLPHDAQESLNLKFHEVQKFRHKKLENELINQNNNLFFINDKISYLLHTLGLYYPESEIRELTIIFQNQVLKVENLNDENRAKKLENLKSEKFNINKNFVPVKVHNFTEKIIPTDIIDILSTGLDTPIGGIPRRNAILTQFELFYSEFARHAITENIDLIKICEIKSLLYLEFLKFCKCSSDTEKVKKLKKFLKNNNDLSINVIDKSKDVGIYTKAEYLRKLDEIFEPNKFLKLKDNPIIKDTRELQALVSEFSGYLSKSDCRKIDPTQSLKKGFGLIKLHRPGAPLRPIISSFNSLTSGSEAFLLELLKPIINECSFSINSTKMFKKHFCEIKNKFDPELYEVCCFDACSLYTKF